MRRCKVCKVVKPRSKFSQRTLAIANMTKKICLTCAASAHARSVAKKETMRLQDGPKAISIGSCDVPCSHCGAKLFKAEARTFCCNNGKYAVDFSQYFTSPPRALMDVYREPSFSAASRMYNNLFALAAHEIQSTSEEKEVYFGNVRHKPANIRIHGTVYRKIYTAADLCPLRFLLVDPKARSGNASKLGLEQAVVRKLECGLLRHNPLMTQIRRLSEYKVQGPDVHIHLRWHEGTQEVAGLVNLHADGKQSARAVVYRLARTGHAQYLHPMNCLYEPLSYPLWFPRGGRGWGSDILTADGKKLTQMWWYRQLALRCEHMHSCGRLLNEWFINMYCRMEDERLSVIRGEQQRRLAHRGELQAIVATAPGAAGPVGKKFYLPASVTGSPRHLRRMRTDCLELCRRKQAPDFFITLTCNPRWPAIVAALQEGQSASDRPDVIVRVFHAKLQKMLAFLREKFCGGALYLVKVIEYQKRGLPHAHIAMKSKNPPASIAALDSLITCQLPTDEGHLRDLVLAHMVHKCTPACRDDESQACRKGCPWNFEEYTHFTERGYPCHQRKPCGGHCPNCNQGPSRHGGRTNCLNQLIVEHCAVILRMWEGHANVKYAANVNLFEYLFKYLFKGPDYAKYDVT